MWTEGLRVPCGGGELPGLGKDPQMNRLQQVHVMCGHQIASPKNRQTRPKYDRLTISLAGGKKMRRKLIATSVCSLQPNSF